MEGDSAIDCNDQGAIYVEAKAKIGQTEIVENADSNVIQKLFPFNPYKLRSGKESELIGMQLNQLDCGAVFTSAISQHYPHSSPLVATTSGNDESITPQLDSGQIFPPQGLETIVSGSARMNIRDKIVTRRFEIRAKNLCKLRSEIQNKNTSSVIAITSLLWKSILEITKLKSGIASHAVNFRSRKIPQLSEHSFGNLWQFSIAALKDREEEGKLDQLADLVKESIKKIDSKYVREMQGAAMAAKAWEATKEAMEGEPEVCIFSSLTKFGVYGLDFGRGKPVWACPAGASVKNTTILAAARAGDGVEAWVTLTEASMAELERNQEFLQFVSPSSH